MFPTVPKSFLLLCRVESSPRKIATFAPRTFPDTKTMKCFKIYGECDTYLCFLLLALLSQHLLRETLPLWLIGIFPISETFRLLYQSLFSVFPSHYRLLLSLLVNHAHRLTALNISVKSMRKWLSRLQGRIRISPSVWDSGTWDKCSMVGPESSANSSGS